MNPCGAMVLGALWWAPVAPPEGVQGRQECATGAGRNRFEMVDETYATILEAFAATTGLEIVGETPEGRTSFNCGRERMGIELALARLAVSLFSHPMCYVLSKRDSLIEVWPSAGTRSLISVSNIYPSAVEFLEDDRSDAAIVCVLWQRESPDWPDDSLLPSVLPSYVRVARYREENALTVFGTVSDARHCLGLLTVLDRACMQARLSTFHIHFAELEPATAVGCLRSQFDKLAPCSSVNSASDIARIRDAEAEAFVWTDWAHRSIVVACPTENVDEIKTRLTRLDRAMVRRQP